MKPITFPLFLAILAGLSLTSLADTITRKNGLVHEGNITKETADKVYIEVKAKGITDEIEVPRAEIASMVKETPDDKAANAILAKLNPPGDNLAAADYEKAIKTDIQPWLDKNKTGNKRKAMEDLLKLYTEEQTKVKAGEIKLRGAWIGVEEKKWNEYNVNARKLRLKFEDLLKAKKYPEAYWVFAEMEATTPAAVDFPPVVDQMRKAIPQLEGAINNAVTEQPALAKSRLTSLASMTPDQQKNENQRIVMERKDFTTTTGVQRKNKYRIIAWYPYDLKTIQDALGAVKKEAEYLGKLNLPEMTSANKKFEAGLKDLNSRAWLSAKSNFEAVLKVYPKDLVVKAKLDEATKGANAPAPKKPGVK